MPNRARRFEAVHLRHLAIHEHEVERNALDHLQRLVTVARDVDAAAQALQQAHGELGVDDVVFGEQHATRRDLRGLQERLGVH